MAFERHSPPTVAGAVPFTGQGRNGFPFHSQRKPTPRSVAESPARRKRIMSGPAASRMLNAIAAVRPFRSIWEYGLTADLRRSFPERQDRGTMPPFRNQPSKSALPLRQSISPSSGRFCRCGPSRQKLPERNLCHEEYRFRRPAGRCCRARSARQGFRRPPAPARCNRRSSNP